MKANFIFADDVQQLADGKPMAVGLYPDMVIIAEVDPESLKSLSKEHPIGMDRLSIMATVTGLQDGAHEARLDVTAPDEQEVPQASRTLRFNSVAGQASTLVFKFAPFLFWCEGAHRVRISVNGDVVEELLTIRLVADASAQRAK